MKKKKTSRLFRIIKFCLRLFYPKMKIIGSENIPDEPCIIVGNHTQMNGPIISELQFSDTCDIWCAGEMMHLKEVPSYAFKDFWSQKPKYTHPFYKALSYMIAPLATVIFNNASTIAVYRDIRISSTFKKTVQRLNEGRNIIIFPEHDVKYNNIIYEFQDKFIHVAKMYYKKTGKELSFVPMYMAPKLKKVYIGEPIRYCGENNAVEERKRICDYLMDAITNTARALPRHIVIPYRNIPKKDYPYNTEEEK